MKTKRTKKWEVERFQYKFVNLLPPADEIRSGTIWICAKYRTINLRCPCGCGRLVVLSLHPTRWQLLFNGKTVTLYDSIWTSPPGCGSHYYIRESKVLEAEEISKGLKSSYEQKEAYRLHRYTQTKKDTIAGERGKEGWWRRMMKKILS